MEIGTGRFCNLFTQLTKQKTGIGLPNIVDNAKVAPSVSIKQSTEIRDEYIVSPTLPDHSMTVSSSMPEADIPESERFKKTIEGITLAMLKSHGINESDWISCRFAVGASGQFEVSTLSIQFREGYQGADMKAIVKAFNQYMIDEKPLSQVVAESDKPLKMFFSDVPNSAYAGQPAKR